MINCELCKNPKCVWHGHAHTLPDGMGCFGFERITNADHIRSMTDDELADFLGRIQYDTAYYCAGEANFQNYPYPTNWLDWLKQEVTE